MFYLRDGFGNELNWLDGFDNFMQQGFTKGFMASDLTEDEKEYKLTIDVPGVDKKDINISFDNKNLIVRVKQVKGEDVKEKHFIRHERFSSNCERSYYLEKADENEIHAKLDNGVLNITVMKKNQEIQNKNVISIE